MNEPGSPEDRLGALLDEAQAAVSVSANTLRDVRERYRVAYHAEVNRWEALRADLGPAANGGTRDADGGTRDADGGTRDANGGRHEANGGTRAANGGTRDANGGTTRGTTSGKAPRNGRSRAARERDEAMAGREVGSERASLARLDLAIKSLENAWLFLDPTDETLVHDPSGPASAADAQMRVVEAQEAERSRLAREVHDGPAQSLSNAIFQVEVVERLLDRDERLARQELKALRDMLTRELRGVRAYLSQLRPPLLADLGLVGAIKEAAEQIGSVLGVPVTVDLDERIDKLPEPVEVVILRIVQEALQNVRKHAKPRSVSVRAAREAGGWVVEIRDDGKGFDLDRSPVEGRRSFGLQFMRERAGLIHSRFEVRSRPELGTVVRMVIPASTEDG